jgi:hypothetical protein
VSSGIIVMGKITSDLAAFDNLGADVKIKVALVN